MVAMVVGRVGKNVSQGPREPHYSPLATPNSPKVSSGPSSQSVPHFCGSAGRLGLGAGAGSASLPRRPRPLRDLDGTSQKSLDGRQRAGRR